MRQVKMNKCLCGCGQLAKNRFVRFHHLSGKCNPNNHRVQSDETKRKISIANSGKKWTKKQKENLSNILKKVWQNPELMKKISVIRKQWIGEKNPFYGKKHTEQSKKKIANRHYKSGKDHHWFKPDRTRQYSLEWQDTLKEAIRERDNYICQRCGVPQEECNRQLDVHHIDGDKINCDPSNLIAFCVSCHSKVERNHRSTINRVNSGNSHVDNPEPSSLKCEKVQRLSEEDTSSLITDKSALQLKADDIVRTSEQSEKNGLLWSKRNFIRGVNMRKIIVLTLLMGFLCMPVFAATDWDEFESGRNNIRLEGYQTQPGYIEFQDGSGSVEGYIYWNDTADELYIITNDEYDKTRPLGTAYNSMNIGVPLSSYTGSGLSP